MPAIAVRKKVISIGRFSPYFCLQSLQIFYLLEQIKSNCMHWMHWKSEKNRFEPNELDELKYSKSLTQMTSHAHWHVLVFACSHMYKNIHLPHLKLEKNYAKWAKWARILKNTLTNEQLCSLTNFFVFACSDKYQNIYSFFRFKIRKKIELNELHELDYSKAASTMSSYTQEHVFLYLHAQTNINTLLYWSYTKS